MPMLSSNVDTWRETAPACDGNTMTGRTEVATNYACLEPGCRFSYVARFDVKGKSYEYRCVNGHVAKGGWKP